MAISVHALAWSLADFRQFPASFPMLPSSHGCASLKTCFVTVRCALDRTNGALPRRIMSGRVPQENKEKHLEVLLTAHPIGNKSRCTGCEEKGLVLCATCAGSGLYVDSILESQGIIVKVRCLGCGGSGSIMCPECGGRGHV